MTWLARTETSATRIPAQVLTHCLGVRGAVHVKPFEDFLGLAVHQAQQPRAPFG